MKITEPKTPYVRYNAETDTVEGGAYAGPSMSPPPPHCVLTGAPFSPPADIPSLDLNGLRTSSPTMSPTTAAATLDSATLARAVSPVSSTGATAGGAGSDPPSRRTSFSSTGRASTPSARSGSRSSSRSTSFNLPAAEAHEVIRLDGRQPGDEVEFEEMDEESACFYLYLLVVRGARAYWVARSLGLSVGLSSILSFYPRTVGVRGGASRGRGDSCTEARRVRARTRAALLERSRSDEGACPRPGTRFPHPVLPRRAHVRVRQPCGRAGEWGPRRVC